MVGKTPLKQKNTFNPIHKNMKSELEKKICKFPTPKPPRFRA